MMARKNPEEPHTRLAFDEADGKMPECIREVVLVVNSPPPSRMDVAKIRNPIGESRD